MDRPTIDRGAVVSSTSAPTGVPTPAAAPASRTHARPWRCHACRALLGVEHDGELHVKYKEVQHWIRGRCRHAYRRCAALAECFRRQHPDRVAPLVLDHADIEQVAFCAAAIDGDAHGKLRALRDSLAGALRTSKGAPPTVRYIWGRIEHFLRHAERGRRIRRAATPPAQTQA